MLTIIKYKLKEQFKGVCFYFAGLFLYAWMMIGLFPSVAKVKDTYSQALPENVLKVFGADNMQSIGTITGFVSLEFLALFFVLILAFYIGSSAGSTIAGPSEKKTVDFSLSQPISRTKFLLSGAIVTIFYIILLVFLTSASMLALSYIHHNPFSASGMFAFFVVASFFLLSFYGIAIFLSSILKNKLSVAGGTVWILVVFYMLTAMTKIVDKLKNYDKFSLFYAYNPQKLLETGVINWTHITILVIVFFAGLVGSLIVFNNKDI